MTTEADATESDRFAQAEEAFDAADYRRAGELWESIASNGIARFNAGNAYRDAKDSGSAVRNYRAALDLGELDAYLNLAFVLMDGGRNAEALQILEQGAIAGDPPSAVQLAFELVESDPGRAEALAVPHADGDSLLGVRATLVVVRGRILRNEGDTTVDGLLGSASALPEGRILVAEVLEELGRDRAAIDLYRDRLDAGEKEAGVPLGNLLLDNDDVSGAEEAYSRGLRLGDNYARFNLGLLLVDRGEIAKGRSLIEEAARQGDELASKWLAGNEPH